MKVGVGDFELREGAGVGGRGRARRELSRGIGDLKCHRCNFRIRYY